MARRQAKRPNPVEDDNNDNNDKNNKNNNNNNDKDTPPKKKPKLARKKSALREGESEVERERRLFVERPRDSAAREDRMTLWRAPLPRDYEPPEDDPGMLILLLQSAADV